MSRYPLWTKTEDKDLKACVAEGKSAEQAAKIVGRPRKCCMMRACRLKLEIPDNEAWLHVEPRPDGFARSFEAVQAKGADAGMRALELAQQSDPSRLALRRFSFQTEGER